MSYDDNEDKEEDISIDVDKLKQQLIVNQEKSLQEQQFSQENIIINEEELIHQINNNDFIEYVIQIVKKTVKCEDSLIRQIL
ncbi:MAG TPA: hypothetical protein VFC05_14860 [Nitrososphaeraceae archaeon]|nr:hypothetical protein [Nitrososphaeraceae archaeon]